MADDCIEEVILGNSEPRTSGDTAENQTPEEILPTDGDHLKRFQRSVTTTHSLIQMIKYMNRLLKL